MSALHRLRAYLTRRRAPSTPVRVGWAAGNHDWAPGRSRVGVDVTREALRRLDKLTTEEPAHDDAELRTAAATLRDAARWASAAPWWVEDTSPRFWGEERDAEVSSSKGTLAVLPHDKGGGLNATWIALLDPGMGPLLADWLDDAARACDATVTAAGRIWPLPCDEAEAFIQEQIPHTALAFARKINAKEQQ